MPTVKYSFATDAFKLKRSETAWKITFLFMHNYFENFGVCVDIKYVYIHLVLKNTNIVVTNSHAQHYINNIIATCVGIGPTHIN